MNNVYILQNQNGFYFSKSGEWVSGEDSKVLFRTEYKDEAINQKVELTVKHADLRVTVATAQPSENGKLVVSQASPPKTELKANETSLFGLFETAEEDAQISSVAMSVENNTHADTNFIENTSLIDNTSIVTLTNKLDVNTLENSLENTLDKPHTGEQT